MSKFLIIFFVGFISCTSNNAQKDLSKDLPKDLDEAINYFDNKWTDQEKEEFIKDSLKNAHFSIGMWIRNSWIRNQCDTLLVKYFNKIGIFHPDDMSSIILTSLYRKLTNKTIDLNKQIEVYKKYWGKINDCSKTQRILATENYKKHRIGDKISIFMPVDTADGQRNAVIYVCPNIVWTYNSKVDLQIDGVIKDKYFINDSNNVFFKVLIVKLNYPNTTVLMKNAKVNRIMDFSLVGLTIK
ncbi:MAG: hypothetical protein Q8907_10020 [Bacteroidota bacterium]|nr:hypothetical protein [Bacteroidota bacterium]MDP4274602.1 hypothetical protein [Bacteroidota bacterium]